MHGLGGRLPDVVGVGQSWREGCGQWGWHGRMTRGRFALRKAGGKLLQITTGGGATLERRGGSRVVVKALPHKHPPILGGGVPGEGQNYPVPRRSGTEARQESCAHRN